MEWENHSPSREQSVSVEFEASSLLRDLVAPPYPGESVKALIGRAARRSGLTFIRAKKLWYGEVRDNAIRAEEMDALRRAARVKQDEAESGLIGELRELRARLARLETRLAQDGASVAGEGVGESG